MKEGTVRGGRAHARVRLISSKAACDGSVCNASVARVYMETCVGGLAVRLLVGAVAGGEHRQAISKAGLACVRLIKGTLPRPWRSTRCDGTSVHVGLHAVPIRGLVYVQARAE